MNRNDDVFSGAEIPQLPPGGILTGWRARAVINVCNAILNSRIVRGSSDAVTISKKNALLQIGPDKYGLDAATSRFHPFKIYNVTHPTDPARNSSAFRVRGGYVGFRSRVQQYNSACPTNSQPIGGNGETELLAASGSDCVYDGTKEHDFWTRSTSTSASATMETVELGNVGDFTVATFGNAATFVLNEDLDSDGGRYAAFWVEITDANVSGTPVANPYAQIKARMWTPGNNVSTGRSNSPFPNAYGNGTGAGISFVSPTTIVIPLGIVSPLTRDLSGHTSSTELTIDQFVSDHLLRRYAPGPISESGLGGHLGPLFFRGVWDGGDTEALSGRTFYDGDVVAVPQTIGGVDYLNLYIHRGKDLETGVLASNGWRQIGGRV